MVLFVLFEHASGLGLFKVTDHEEIGANMDQYQRSTEEFGLFARVCQLAAFRAFASAEEALDNILQLSESQATPLLLDLLSTSLPADATLGVGDERLAVSIQENSKVKCQKNAVTAELIRGVRLHFAKYVSLSGEEASRSQLGLGHSYSRSKVKFNVNRVDNMIIQSIALIDQIDKDLNTFAMRCREWYSWHFPELYAVVADNVVFSKLVVAIGDKAQLTPDKVDKINAIVNGDANLSEAIQHAAKHSMGMEIAEIDLQTVVNFAERVSSLAAYRLRLHAYLRDKMNSVAPNLAALIGEMVGARLISHAGSLTSLAKYPASTVQILGAEKALFRALKAKGNTPKYGLIFHSSFIGKASSKNKGRISRYLANKCSIASRLDCFSDTPTDKFGVKLREQVEERLAFYEGGAVPRKNVDVMREVLAEVQQDVGLPLPGEKRDRAAGAETKEDAATPSSSSKKHKKDKKDKKDKKKKEKKDKKKSGSKK